MIALLLLTLQADLDAIAKQSGGAIGILVQPVERKETAGVNAQRAFMMASTFKLPLAVIVLRDVERKRFPPLDGKVRLLPEDMRPWATPLYERMPRGGDATLREVVSSLLESSDNSAADALLRLCGGPARVTAELRALHQEGISIDRSEGEIYIATHDNKAGLARFRTDPRDRATPQAMAQLLARAWRGDLLSPAHTTYLRDELGRCQTGKHRLAAGLPPQAHVADRIGTCPGELCANDIAMITLPSGEHVIVAAFVENPNSKLADKERILADIGRAIAKAYAR